MDFWIVTLFYSLISVVLSQNITVPKETTVPVVTTTSKPIENKYSYLANLNVSFVEGYLGEILLDLYNSSDTPLLLKDLIDLASLQNLTLNKTCEILTNRNISLENVLSIDNLEQTLNFFNIEFSIFWQNFTSKLKLNSTSKQSFITNFGISPLNFSFVYSFQPEKIYEFLKEGNYSIETFNSSLEIIEKTPSETFEAFRNILIEQFDKSLEIPKENFTTLKSDFFRLWKEFNISAADVSRVKNFQTKLDTLMEKFNQHPLYGVFTNNIQFVIHWNLYSPIHDYKRISKAIKVQANGLNVFYHRSMSDRIFELKSEANSSGFIPIGYGTPKRCHVLHLVNGVYDTKLIKIMSAKNGLITTKLDPTINYIEGGPLICENKLYGLAGDRNVTIVVFDAFPESDSIVPANTAGNRMITKNDFLFTLILVICILVLLP